MTQPWRAQKSCRRRISRWKQVSGLAWGIAVRQLGRRWMLHRETRRTLAGAPHRIKQRDRPETQAGGLAGRRPRQPPRQAMRPALQVLPAQIGRAARRVQVEQYVSIKVVAYT